MRGPCKECGRDRPDLDMAAHQASYAMLAISFLLQADDGTGYPDARYWMRMLFDCLANPLLDAARDSEDVKGGDA